jgi:hypothetical protein
MCLSNSQQTLDAEDKACVPLRLPRVDGWPCTLRWVTCSVVALHVQIDHLLSDPDLTTNSIEYLEVYTGQKFHSKTADEPYAFRRSLHLATFSMLGYSSPKASVIAFYW